MLDKDTRQTIDNARDILVGKVPNPVTQIDLITTAMIYKFMDDMDLENISFGGERVFFVGDLEQYSWSKLLSAAVGNSERISLYTQALEKLPYARQIPQLFRSIFKDAFLPFRDGATLTLFLNEINSLSYNNSENLGDGFEYLLSVMGSQGDAGQFRTPRHIIDFIVEAVNPGKDDAVLDPACGTAGFLISAYKHIIKTANEQKKTLSVDAIRQIAQNITGYDIDPTMQKLSLVNLYLHNFAAPKVYEYDTLTSEDRWGDKFDVILANPPFMTPKGGIRPHNRFGIRANKSEVLFVDYFMEHLTLNGRAGFVVPEGIIFQSATAYKSLRKMMVEDNYLYAVVSLPAGVFNPYSGVKTSILFFDKQLAKKTDKILFVEVKNDGFDLGAQRRPIKENDLPAAFQAIREYQKSYNKKDLKLPDNCLLVEKSKIAENGDYNLTASRYRQTAQVINSKWEMVKLGDVCEVLNGYAFKSDLYVPKGHRVMRITNVQRGYLSDSNPKFYACDDALQQYDLREKDILLSLTGNVGRVGMMTKEFLPAYLNQRVACLRIKTPNILEQFLFFILNTDDFEELCISNSNGIAQKNLSTEFVKNIQIPLPPLEVQQEIVKELEGYQAIINGSQEIIDNWKPSFTIKPNWPKVKLGDVCEKSDETIDPQEKTGIVNYIGLENIVSSKMELTGTIEHPYSSIKSTKNIFQKDDVLYGKLRPNLNKVYLAKEDGICSTDILVLRAKNNILPKLLAIVLASANINAQILQGIKGAQLPRVGFNYMSSIEFYLPSLDEQKDIVDKIAFEEQYINTCKEYVAHFKQKIADKIQTIWSSK